MTANTTHLAILLKLSRTIIEKVALNNIKLLWIPLSLSSFILRRLLLGEFYTVAWRQDQLAGTPPLHSWEWIVCLGLSQQHCSSFHYRDGNSYQTEFSRHLREGPRFNYQSVFHPQSSLIYSWLKSCCRDTSRLTSVHDIASHHLPGRSTSSLYHGSWHCSQCVLTMFTWITSGRLKLKVRSRTLDNILQQGHSGQMVLPSRGHVKSSKQKSSKNKRNER